MNTYHLILCRTDAVYGCASANDFGTRFQGLPKDVPGYIVGIEHRHIAGILSALENIKRAEGRDDAVFGFSGSRLQPADGKDVYEVIMSTADEPPECSKQLREHVESEHLGFIPATDNRARYVDALAALEADAALGGTSLASVDARMENVRFAASELEEWGGSAAPEQDIQAALEDTNWDMIDGMLRCRSAVAA